MGGLGKIDGYLVLHIKKLFRKISYVMYNAYFNKNP